MENPCLFRKTSLMYEYTIKEITRIIDGDTLDIVFDLGFSMFTKQRVRLNRIDTPETNSKDALEHKLGIEVKEFVAMWCASQDIMRIKTSKDDKYGRMLADIYGKDDICLNDLLVTSGYAWAYFGDKKVKDFSILSEKRKLYEATTLH